MTRADFRGLLRGAGSEPAQLPAPHPKEEKNRPDWPARLLSRKSSLGAEGEAAPDSGQEARRLSRLAPENLVDRLPRHAILPGELNGARRRERGEDLLVVLGWDLPFGCHARSLHPLPAGRKCQRVYIMA